MAWDDLQLLRVLDDMDQRYGNGALINGILLMQDPGLNELIGPMRDQLRLARELALARDDGYLTLDEGSWSGRPVDPSSDPNLWLQRLQKISLTTAGRDRARGRVVLRQLPEPDEDDERPIPAIILEEIARSIGSQYNAAQLPKFLKDSGIPESSLPPVAQGDKWEYVLAVFEYLHEHGFAGRRALRHFIGGWLDDRLMTGPGTDERRRILRQLARTGWRVHEGRLVIAEPQVGDPERPSLSGRDAQFALLHARIRSATQRFLASDHLDVAIFEAFKAINIRVKAMTAGMLDTDGMDLMARAFRVSDPALVLADLSTQTGRDIQEGFRFMFMGAVTGIRNPDAHELFQPLNDDEAFEKLAFASMLMRRLDDVKTSH